ncbi:MAG: LysM peptidoglycan-binding domain-containing protein [Thermoflexales bacterium]|nr:LysM peptidoglycan-binding domain-containing protein [Thermoflexales bacterium]
MCGHEFGTTQAMPRIEPSTKAAEPQRSRATNRVRPLPRGRSSAAQIPWGVIGIVVVIAAIILGAMWLAQSIGLTQPFAEPTIQVVIQDATDAENGLIAGGSQLAFAPTPTTAPPTATPAPSPTPVPPLEYVVQSGDTCGGIAQRFGVSLGELAALNNLDIERCLIRIGDKLLIPLPSPTPLPGATAAGAASGPQEPTATLPAQIVYVVKGGDTCSEIAQRFNISLDQLIQQNNLDANCLIRMNQVLTITFATPTPAAMATPFVLQTPTPRTGYSAPIVMQPIDGARISDAQTTVTLQWLTVGMLQQNEWYVVQVQPAGALTVPIFETKATSLKLTQDILGDRDEREIAWWVQVKRFIGVEPGTNRRMYIDLSPPSVPRRFVWRKPTTATATPGS